MMLVVSGLINFFEGLLAIVDDKRVVMAAENLVVVDLTGWGWTLLFFGLAMAAAGLGLLWARSWARYLAIVIVALHAISQVGWLAAYPVWCHQGPGQRRTTSQRHAAPPLRRM